MKTPFFFLYLTVGVLVLASARWSQAAELLTVTRLQEIIASPHSETPLVQALSIYPKAREYQLKIENKGFDGATKNTQATATEKWVEGRYIVSELRTANPEAKFVMVVEFDQDSNTYRKYMLIAGRYTGAQAGRRVGNSRSISWIDVSPVRFTTGDDCMTTETHTDTGTTWVSLFYNRGNLIRTETGTATVTK